MLLHLVRATVGRWAARRLHPNGKIALIERGLADLPVAHRRAYRLRCIDCLTSRDAATLLGVSEEQVERDLAAALAALARSLDER